MTYLENIAVSNARTVKTEPRREPNLATEMQGKDPEADSMAESLELQLDHWRQAASSASVQSEKRLVDLRIEERILYNARCEMADLSGNQVSRLSGFPIGLIQSGS
jgi:hypothetical protein